MTQALFDLGGKTAFITGATKGIGRSIAEAFADHGAIFALTSRHGHEAQVAAAEINARVGREAAIGLESDLRSLSKSLAAYDQAVARLERIDILVSLQVMRGPKAEAGNRSRLHGRRESVAGCPRRGGTRVCA